MTKDPYLGLQIGKYVIKELIGTGKIGRVYKAVDERVGALQACKFIPEPRSGWLNEITKVVDLQGVPHVVQYRDYDEVIVEQKKVTYIMWDYVPGTSLRRIAEENALTVSLLSEVVTAILIVLQACQARNIVHADLHWGNVIVQDPDESILPNQRRIWITDFGYYTVSRSAKEKIHLLDDFKGLASIINECLSKINFHRLEVHERHLFKILHDDLPKYLLETSPVEHPTAHNANELYKTWIEMKDRAVFQSRGEPPQTRIDDYPVAEMIGDRWEEWKSLFVPNCIGIADLTSRNISVFTGTRGCGKSMIFRRLTAVYDIHLGPSGVNGSDSFLGFYLNARHLVEAFPWLPSKSQKNARNQILHYFHVCWCLEVLDWIDNLSDEQKPNNFTWLRVFFCNHLPQTKKKELVLDSFQELRSFLVRERERSRLHTNYTGDSDSWPFSTVEFLSSLWNEITKYVLCVGERPMFCFLDDYSTPLVSPTMQKILNPVVFSRRPLVFFKVSTEDVWSFERVGLGNKFLEEGHDFTLINVGVESLILSRDERTKILTDLLSPRIKRHSKLREYSLERILGPTPYRFTELAWALRGESKGNHFKGEKPKVEYGGLDVFSAIWSSDTREMIGLFSRMIDEIENRIDDLINAPTDGIVPLNVQDTVLRDAGGSFVSSRLAAATPPIPTESMHGVRDRSYGEHLCKIAKALQQIAKFELDQNDSMNEGVITPKQARRIEITDTDNDLPDALYAYYLGLTRYGVLLRDYRAKSVRKRVSTRLVLRGLLIPYFMLSPSRRDNIPMSWDEFRGLLENPDEAVSLWQKKRRGRKDPPGQLYLDTKEK